MYTKKEQFSSNRNVSLRNTQRRNKTALKRSKCLFLSIASLTVTFAILLLYLNFKIKDEIIAGYQKEKEINQLNTDIDYLGKNMTIKGMQLDSLIRDIAITNDTKAYIKSSLITLKDKQGILLKTIDQKKRLFEIVKKISVILSVESMQRIENLTQCTFLSNCYRMSRDGNSAKAFHEKCNDIKPTVTIIQGEYNNLYGGFTTQSWNGKGWKTDDKAFLFSLLYSTVLYCRKNMPAITASPDLLPTFGIDDMFLSEKGFSIRTYLQSYTVNTEIGSHSVRNDKRVEIKVNNVEVFQMKCNTTD